MKISFDAEADALYLEIADGKFHTNQKVDATTTLDLDKAGRVLGLEIIGVRKRLGKKGTLELMVQVQQGKALTALTDRLQIPLTV